ncbi:MAG: glycosyltransferase, partial [Anaerolineae bacterium]|nr:glycosyltransferase [Anaerolineae bacterium]
DGLHYAVGDPQDLARKLQKLIDQPQLSQEYGANIRLPPTAEWVSEQIEAIYHKLMEKHALNGTASGRAAGGASIIIPAYNEEKYIGACLDSLVKQTYPNLEIIVVDDGSDDRTVSIVQDYVARDSRFRLLRQNHQGPGEARNLAAKEAKGEFLLFCDADMMFAPDYTEKLIAPILRGEALGTFSKEEYVRNFTNVWARSWNLHDGMTDDRRHPPDFPDEHSVYRAVRRNKFLESGGFSTRGSGDDRTIAQKLGQLAKVAPGAICYHHNPDTLGEVFRQARWYARGQRIPFSWSGLITHTPLFSIARSIRRAIRYNNPMFPVFKIVHDFGIFRGMVDKRL